jgi:hypothetical protein
LDNKIKNLQYEREKASSLYYKEMTQLEVKKKMETVRELELNNELKEQKLKKRRYEEDIQKNGLEMHQNLNGQNITILSGGHTFFDRSGQILDKDIRHHYHKD